MKLELVTVGIILALCKSGKYCHQLRWIRPRMICNESDVNKPVSMEIESFSKKESLEESLDNIALSGIKCINVIRQHVSPSVSLSYQVSVSLLKNRTWLLIQAIELNLLSSSSLAFAINCFHCNSSDTSKPFECGEWFERFDKPDIVPSDCSNVHGAKYCIKHIGRFEGLRKFQRFSGLRRYSIPNTCQF